MRGDDCQEDGFFSYISWEQRVPQGHPLRRLRALVDPVLQALSPRFTQMYARVGRPSIAPEKLLRALLLQGLYSIRSERLWMEQLDYNLLFRWFVGLRLDDPVWDATVYSRTGSGCWRPTSPRPSSSRWWSWRGSTTSFRTSISPWMAPCLKPGPGRRVSNPKHAWSGHLTE